MIKIKKLLNREAVYDISVKDNHNFYANKILVHNCVEVTHPTKPIQHIDDPEGEIGICVLSAINVLEIKDDQDLIDTCDTIVRMLDEIIDYQEYFTKAAENFTKKRRSLGIGITNLAALLAKNNLKYMDAEAPNFVDTLMEKIQYHLIASSVELAKEKGRCEKFNTTKYSLGVLPIDTYKKKVDQVVTRKPSLDWDELRQRVLTHGMRHSTLTAMMPCESSSVIQNSTNGIEPPRSLLTYKGSKANSVPLLVPNYSTYKNKYTLQFDMPDNTGYINIVAAIQKWTDMAISANLYYNYDHYPNKALPDSVILKELLYAYSMGVKTLYYSNTYDGDKQSATDEGSGCVGGSCTI
jgi:ribonucleoside-diphosphate reductase alpha chain